MKQRGFVGDRPAGYYWTKVVESRAPDYCASVVIASKKDKNKRRSGFGRLVFVACIHVEQLKQADRLGEAAMGANVVVLQD